MDTPDVMAGVRGGARPFTRGDLLMKTVAFYNNKGGVGKTTFAVHFALHAAQYRGLRTVAVGLDRQGDMMRWLSGGEMGIGDGSVFSHSANLAAIYSPNQMPNFRMQADLAVVDTSPSLALASAVRADLVCVPVDGRLAVDDLQNALPDLIDSQAKLLIVINRADTGGARTLAALKKACAKIPKTTVWATAVPDSPAIKRAAEYYRPVWEVPYGESSAGSRILQELGDGILRLVGFGAR